MTVLAPSLRGDRFVTAAPTLAYARGRIIIWWLRFSR
jgi:hypothetical protein